MFPLSQGVAAPAGPGASTWAPAGSRLAAELATADPGTAAALEQRLESQFGQTHNWLPTLDSMERVLTTLPDEQRELLHRYLFPANAEQLRRLTDLSRQPQAMADMLASMPGANYAAGMGSAPDPAYLSARRAVLGASAMPGAFAPGLAAAAPAAMPLQASPYTAALAQPSALSPFMQSAPAPAWSPYAAASNAWASYPPPPPAFHATPPFAGWPGAWSPAAPAWAPPWTPPAVVIHQPSPWPSWCAAPPYYPYGDCYWDDPWDDFSCLGAGALAGAALGMGAMGVGAALGAGLGAGFGLGLGGLGGWW